MRKIAFNDGWTCRHAVDSGKGKPVTIPHDAMLDEKRTPIMVQLSRHKFNLFIMNRYM